MNFLEKRKKCQDEGSGRSVRETKVIEFERQRVPVVRELIQTSRCAVKRKMEEK